jgi:Zn finger protein HypA/HybF involved in hydrogenase expression
MWILKCEICNHDFEATSSEMTCPVCGQVYRLENDYRLILTSEQLNLLRLDFLHKQKADPNG